MFIINNGAVQNKPTGGKVGSGKIVGQYLIRILQRTNLAEKQYSCMYDYSVPERNFVTG